MTLHRIDYNGGEIWADKKAKIAVNDYAYNPTVNTLGVVAEVINMREDIDDIITFDVEAQLYSRSSENNFYKVVGQSTNLSLPNIPYVEIEEDVEESAYILANLAVNGGKPLHKWLHGVELSKAVDFGFDMFLQGYRAASAKKYTEEDLSKIVVEALYKFKHFEEREWCEHHSKKHECDIKESLKVWFNNSIQSLKPKVASIEIEMTKNGNTGTNVLEWVEPVTYNKDGKTFLKVIKVNHE